MMNKTMSQLRNAITLISSLSLPAAVTCRIRMQKALNQKGEQEMMMALSQARPYLAMAKNKMVCVERVIALKQDHINYDRNQDELLEAALMGLVAEVNELKSDLLALEWMRREVAERAARDLMPLSCFTVKIADMDFEDFDL